MARTSNSTTETRSAAPVKAAKKSTAAAPAAKVEPATPREVRIWAKANGHEVAPKGRLKVEVLTAYTAATGRPVLHGVSTS